jgi:hypothetical protein
MIVYFENSAIDSYSRMKMLEAESDFKSYKNAYINSHERQVDCIQMLNTIRTIKNTIDSRVFKIHNHKGEAFIIYVKYNQVYLPSINRGHLRSVLKGILAYLVSGPKSTPGLARKFTIFCGNYVRSSHFRP